MKILFLLLSGTIIYFSAFSQKPLTEEKIRQYFSDNKDSLDDIEGIWQVSTTQEYYRYDTLEDDLQMPRAAKVAIMKDSSRYKSFNLKGESSDVEFQKTDVKGVYFYRIYFPETKEYSRTDAVISKKGEMEYEYRFPDKYLRVKLADTYEAGTSVTNKTKWTKIFP